MAPEKKQVLGRLQKAIQKVKFLLLLDRSRWLLSSFLTRSRTQTSRLSFKNQPAGLLDITDGDNDDDFYEVGSNFVLSRSTSLASSTSTASEIERSTSDASSPDDINRRAEHFIANFYKHIRMERQVSLELRYLRAKDGSLERTRSQ